MSLHSVNPGNLHVRLGAVLQLREVAISQGEIAIVSDLQDTVFDYCSVYMTKGQQDKYESMPGLAYGDGRSRNEIMADLRRKLRYVFQCVKAHNVFSKSDVEEGDADALDNFPEEPLEATA